MAGIKWDHPARVIGIVPFRVPSFFLSFSSLSLSFDLVDAFALAHMIDGHCISAYAALLPRRPVLDLVCKSHAHTEYIHTTNFLKGGIRPQASPSQGFPCSFLHYSMVVQGTASPDLCW